MEGVGHWGQMAGGRARGKGGGVECKGGGDQGGAGQEVRGSECGMLGLGCVGSSAAEFLVRRQGCRARSVAWHCNKEGLGLRGPRWRYEGRMAGVVC